MKVFIQFILLVLTLLFPSSLYCQTWWQLKPEQPDTITTLTKCGQYVFAGTSSKGVLRSFNDGLTWSYVNDGLNQKRIIKLFSIPETRIIFAGTDVDSVNGGIYKSTNYGESWELYRGNVHSVGSFAFTRHDNIIYAGDYQRLVKSSNFGDTWEDATGTLGWSGEINDIIYFNDALFIAKYSQGVLKTTDSGQTWQKKNNGLANLKVRCFAKVNENLFVGTEGGVFVSLDYGESWINTNLGDVQVYSLHVSNDTLLAGIRGSGYPSYRNPTWFYSSLGSNWEQASNAIPKINDSYYNSIVMSFVSSNNKIIAGTWGQGTFWSEDNGKIWTAPNFNRENISSLFWLDDNLFVTSGISGNETPHFRTPYAGIFSLDWNGNQWYYHPIRSKSRNIVHAISSDGILYYVTSYTDETKPNLFYGEFWWSTDVGITWQTSNHIFNPFTTFYVFQNYILASLLWGSARSTDLGKNWINYGDDWVTSYGFFYDGNILYANGGGYGFYLSTDNGASWIKQSNQSFLSMRSIITKIDSVLFITTDEGLFKSIDNGISWSQSNLGLLNTDVRSLISFNKILILGTTEGIYKSSNLGLTWQRINGTLPATTVTSILVNEKYDRLYIGTEGDGLWTTYLSNIVTEVDDNFTNAVPSDYLLYQNYPNPFNPSTTIKYSVPKYSFVTIKIFDIIGKEIATLVNEEKAPGNYSIDFNSNNLSSGIYVYTMKSNGFFYSRKMSVLK